VNPPQYYQKYKEVHEKYERAKIRIAELEKDVGKWKKASKDLSAKHSRLAETVQALTAQQKHKKSKSISVDPSVLIDHAMPRRKSTEGLMDPSRDRRRSTTEPNLAPANPEPEHHGHFDFARRWMKGSKKSKKKQNNNASSTSLPDQLANQTAGVAQHTAASVVSLPGHTDGKLADVIIRIEDDDQ
jgi:hypothetical protein